MPPTRPSTPKRVEAPIRDRGDACPGALRLHQADDGRLARLRLPGGLLTSHQVRALALAADSLGDGHLSITSRGNVELRGLGDDCGSALAELLRDAGLLPSETHERVRNVVASPLAGLDGLGRADVQLWVRELDALLCAAPWSAALSGRFLFALDDGRGDVAGLGADVTLIAEPDAGSARVRVGVREVCRVPADDAPRAALAAARAFLAAARAAGTGAWRVRELPPGRSVDVAAHLAEAGLAFSPVDAAAAAPARAGDGPAPGGTAAPGPRPLPGVVTPPGTPAPGPVAPPAAVSVVAPLGRVTSAQMRALLPADEVRVTPWRGLVVTGFADRRAATERLAALDAAGLITSPDSPWLGTGACTGRPGCAKSLSDVRADATPGTGGLPVHWSGCERRCGHPQGAWVDVVATGDGVYEVTVRDGAAARPVPMTRAGLAATVAAARTTTR
ncbi:cobalamin biosynthesis protein CobG [Streptomyces sp. SP18CS02]|uniref:cobalamin biosynthesis protein CobG n=1 Tax=Streptomyces sp. SP18CS02 TaxID=3002531 RepID=UPI003FCE3A54